jgi:hypothetical protein
MHTLPPGYRHYYYRGRPYYFSDGFCYERRPGGYFTVRPPIGCYASGPPPYYTATWIGGVPYYYASDPYYQWADSRSAYEMVGNSPGIEAPRPPSPAPLKDESSQFTFVYPRNGQSTEQQATDRYECHTWSRDQTGFDPTQPGGGVKKDDNGPRSGEYQGAVSACLEARGYSVK